MDFSSHKNKQICNSMNQKMSSKTISAKRYFNLINPMLVNQYSMPYAPCKKRSRLHESNRALSRSNCYIKWFKGEPITNKYLVPFSKGKQFEAYLACETALFRKNFIQFKKFYDRFLSESHLISIFVSCFLLHITLMLLLHSVAYPQGCELFNTATQCTQFCIR